MTEVNEGTNPTGRPTAEKVALFAIIIVAALVAGYYLAQALVPTPKIGLITLDTQVTDFLADTMAAEINYARQSDDIKGIVLVINSPGGNASAGHDIYYQVRKLRETKPGNFSMR